MVWLKEKKKKLAKKKKKKEMDFQLEKSKMKRMDGLAAYKENHFRVQSFNGSRRVEKKLA